MSGEFNQHGGLTLVGLRGYEALINTVKDLIETKSGNDGGKTPHTPVDIVRPEIKRFANGEPDVRLRKQHVGGHDIVVVTSGPGTNDMIMETLWVLNHLAAHRASRIMLVTGYFPLSRSDKDEAEVRLTTPPMVINWFKMASMHPNGKDCLLCRVVCADPHSVQLTMAGDSGFITPIFLTRRLLRPTITDALEQNKRIALAFPDNSAVARFEPAILKVQKSLDIEIPIVVAIKRRDMLTGKSTLVGMQGDLENLEGSLVIMCDDEIDTGGSIMNMATLLRDMYKVDSVWAAVIHAVFSDPAPQRFMFADSPVDRVLAMNTIPHNNRSEIAPLIECGRLNMYPWLEDLAWLILMHHWKVGMREAR